jgi:ribosomal protein S12 methylthiotransferase accessory factor YcaO
MPYVATATKPLNPSVEEALQELAQEIFTAYQNGQKGQARAQFSQIKRQRIGLVTAYLFRQAAGDATATDDMWRFILSVTS